MDYRLNIIKEYDNWTLFLHENQCYLGRCYLWYKHDEPVDMFELEGEPLKELYAITRKVKAAISKKFSPGMYNYSSLNNVIRHLHFHLIPRYDRKIVFNNTIFEDKHWGANYSPYDYDFSLSLEMMQSIKVEIQTELNCEV